jgi:hypothetical protein
VLIGENFPSPPSKWFLISNSQGPNAQNITLNVLSHCIPGCYHLSQPDQTTSPKQSQQLFSWVWKAPSFPNQPVSSEFYFVVQLKNGAIVSSNGSPNFTLLSSDPICIDIINSNANTARCNPDQREPQQRVAGSTATVIGTNWLLGPPQLSPEQQTVTIIATCAPQHKCNQHSVTLLKSIPVLSNGRFTTQINIPAKLRGTFTITATNQVADPAGSVLTFGDTFDPLHLTLTISSRLLPSRPSPSFDDVLWAITSIIFAIPALMAIVGFLILQPWKRRMARPLYNEDIPTPNKNAQEVEKAIRTLMQGDMYPLLVFAQQAMRLDRRKWQRLCEDLALADISLDEVLYSQIIRYVNKIITQSIPGPHTPEEIYQGLIACQLYLRFLKRDSRKRNSKTEGDVWSIMARIYRRVPLKEISPQGVDIQEEALSCYKNARTIYHQKAFYDLEANTLCSIADVYVDAYNLLGDRSYLQQAEKYYEDALTLYHRIYQGQNDPKNIQQKIEKRLHDINKL